MKKIKSTFDYMKEIRGVWVINPRTRMGYSSDYREILLAEVCPQIKQKET